jgi:hypothetical protein
MKDTIQSIIAQHDNQIKKSANEYMKEVIIPFCKKHKLKFDNNTWGFWHPLAGKFNGDIAKNSGSDGDANYDRVKFFSSMNPKDRDNLVEDIFDIERGLWAINKCQYFYSVDFTEQ